MLGLAANLFAAGLLAFTMFFYAVVYSMWLKRSTPQNIVIGGAAGAFPPMIGWACATGGVSLESALMFALIFMWTPPHFWALALFMKEDYSNAGVPMLTVTHGRRATRPPLPNWGIPTVARRYFTVYGPRQRPDMAMCRLIEAVLGGEPFPRFGDGSHIRDFTFVIDVVRANLAAATADVAPGTVVNVAGGGSISMRELIDLVGELAGADVPLVALEARAGDVQRTGGSIARAAQLLGWQPQTTVREGVTAQLAWRRAQEP